MLSSDQRVGGSSPSERATLATLNALNEPRLIGAAMAATTTRVCAEVRFAEGGALRRWSPAEEARYPHKRHPRT